MGYYHRKSGRVEAVQFDGTNHSEIADLIGRNRVLVPKNNFDKQFIVLNGYDVRIVVRKYDWIAKWPRPALVVVYSPIAFNTAYEPIA